ncbi:MAG: hypothetical protein VB080_07370 [Propionicimonas sp.]|uniref:hypothetical protein n=1 Tax=Propionicimonas sp. TaxID=1955623 RepID=UPI002B2128E0|nr:hypothetical protein [Propionicimonas sp.]MEA4944243.1 hypothetical protein [Propionicimonas sp.]MEA5052981.1 hypothetical protein [Propionicimonas sp.]
MSRLKRLAVGAVVVLTVAAVAVGGTVVWRMLNREPLPLADRCTATTSTGSATITADQAYYAALISGVSVKRGLVPRAASIALATAFQESGLRNLDYGHADSLGLFQQRPSQGWGTESEIMDPWYSSTQFYKALVKVKGWKDGDINDVAQAVQRSAHPEAYRKHVDRARILASALAGETPAGFSCRIGEPSDPNPDAMASFLTKTFGKKVSVETGADRLVVTADEPRTAWSVAHAAVAGVAEYGVTGVELGNWHWTHDPRSAAAWHGTGSTDAEVVVLTFPESPAR